MLERTVIDVITTVRDSIGSTIYFSTYESAKQLLVKIQRSDSPTSPLSVAISGALCGTAGWICVSSSVRLENRIATDLDTDLSNRHG